MKLFQRLASERFVIGWGDAFLLLFSGAGLGALVTIALKSLFSSE